MAEESTLPATELTDLDVTEWFDEVEALADDLGAFEPVGPAHSAVFIETGPKLLVTFEAVPDIRRTKTAEPLAWDMVRRNGWSSLTLLSHDQSWFRDPAVYGYFDRLVDDGFFEDFDQVLFFGIGPRGYAAAAYSVAAPGCRVLALRPQATLTPALAGWDDRFRHARRQDFTTRYGFAPDMLDAADHATVLFDPSVREDAMHAAMFAAKPQVQALPLRGSGARIERMVTGFGILPPLLEAEMDGTLTRSAFGQLARRRRTQRGYLRPLVESLEAAGQLRRARVVCDHALRVTGRPFFRDKLAVLEDALAHENRAPRPERGAAAE